LFCAALGRAAALEQEEAGHFDYYVLVLGWSPAYCASVRSRRREEAQCNRANPRAFSLHGLWPQYLNGWPQGCVTEKRPWVPRRVIEEMRDIMPSKSLIIHEYRAHGTCSGLGPEQYFGIARELYERITIPPRFAAMQDPLAIAPSEIERDFLSANPWLKPDTISVSCRRNALLDVRICFGRDLFPRSCGANEEQRLCRSPSVTVSPPQTR
jgi:ribonuclease T2